MKSSVLYFIRAPQGAVTSATEPLGYISSGFFCKKYVISKDSCVNWTVQTSRTLLVAGFTELQTETGEAIVFEFCVRLKDLKALSQTQKHGCGKFWVLG